MITDVYNCLLHEAKTSPLLLSDLAGLETYISESYSNRSFIEMLQNADDAASTHFYIERHNQYLIIANNGRVFDINDIESLCRSASSKKNRGSSIGYRGIGFKSVVSIANEVHLISGTYQITFSRELTKQLLPNATNIPLIRIPHPIRISIFNEIKDHINTLRKRGLNTFFIFTGVKMEQIEDEYLSFPQTSLLFLRNIRFVEIHLKNKKVVKLNLSSISDYVKKITIKNEKEESNWEVYTKENCSIAFNIKDNRISKLPKNESLLHAFLPTEDISGLGVIINADFSTDPSRRHIIFDDSTKDVIKQVAKLYHEMLQEHIIFPSEHSNEYVDSLTPYFDIRLIHLTKNYFEKSFSFELKSLAERTLIDLKICPRWLNIRDFVLIVNKTSTANINEDCYSVEGFQSLLKYFGCKTLDINEIIEHIDEIEISLHGYSQIASEAIRQITMNIDIPLFLDAKIFSSNNNLSSLSSINENDSYIDNSYLQLLQDNGTTQNDLKICLKKYSLNNILRLQFLQNENNNNETKHSCGCSIDNLNCRDKESDIFSNVISPRDTKNVSENNLTKTTFSEWLDLISENKEESTCFAPKKWRTVEENTLLILNSNGFNLKDVSKQNVGYDLEGNDPKGNIIYIEVKSLEYYGQKFRMTNNEFAVAQYKPNNYYLALVVLSASSIEISLIKDPINKLKLNRQCVQWVWECSEYKCTPFKFTFD